MRQKIIRILFQMTNGMPNLDHIDSVIWEVELMEAIQRRIKLDLNGQG